MRTEYRIIATMTFDTPEDRNEWYIAIRTSVINARDGGSLPVWNRAHMNKDDYDVPERVSEDMTSAV